MPVIPTKEVGNIETRLQRATDDCEPTGNVLAGFSGTTAPEVTNSHTISEKGNYAIVSEVTYINPDEVVRTVECVIGEPKDPPTDPGTLNVLFLPANVERGAIVNIESKGFIGKQNIVESNTLFINGGRHPLSTDTYTDFYDYQTDTNGSFAVYATIVYSDGTSHTSTIETLTVTEPPALPVIPVVDNDPPLATAPVGSWSNLVGNELGQGSATVAELGTLSSFGLEGLGASLEAVSYQVILWEHITNNTVGNLNYVANDTFLFWTYYKSQVFIGNIQEQNALLGQYNNWANAMKGRRESELIRIGDFPYG